MDLRDGNAVSHPTKGGVFVIYNCARLNTLFSNFEKAVREGELLRFKLCQINTHLIVCFVFQVFTPHSHQSMKLISLRWRKRSVLITKSVVNLSSKNSYLHILFCTGSFNLQEEWALLFNYVLVYPDLVQNCVKDVCSARVPKVSIHTHKVCLLLLDTRKKY